MEPPLEKLKNFFEEIKRKHKNIVIKYPIKTEYSWDGTVYKEYEIYPEESNEENTLTIIPDDKKTASYFKLWDIDYSFAFIENLPKISKNYKFIYENNKVIFAWESGGRMVFDSSLSGGCIEVVSFKDGKIIDERIFGGYSLINNIVHLPCFSSIACIHSDRTVDQTLHIVEKYELRPVNDEEFIIKLLPNTKIIDYSFGKEP
ncbi:MAG: hypothetical protein ACK4F0_01310 [Candidatus Ratteibacteria bacterium]